MFCEDSAPETLYQLLKFIQFEPVLTPRRFLDPIGAVCIACLILFSWASTAFGHMWFLVGKTAPQDFLNKLVYVCYT